MTYNKPIEIHRLNDDEKWACVLRTHAAVNNASYSEFFASGAEQNRQAKIFYVRWNPIVKEIEFNTQFYSILYDGARYDLTEYDDYRDTHRSVKLLGEAHGT